MNSKIKKYVLDIGILILIFAGTSYYIFKDQDLNEIIRYMHKSSNFYIILSVIMVIMFVCGESVIIHYIMNSMSHKVRLRSCIKYSFIGFFISSITPSASGGQPAQMYYMNEDGIRISTSSLVLMVVTIAYKSALLILGFFMFVTEKMFVFKHVFSIRWILLIGVLLNIIIVALLFFIIFEQNFAKRVLVAPIMWLGKKHIIKNYEHRTKKVLGGVTKYANGAKFLKEHKYVIFNVFVMTIIQRLCIFMVTYFIYKSLGLSGTSAYKIVTLQTMIALTVDNLPLPGGMGASESIFVVFFSKIFTTCNGINLVLPGMVLSRGISFYLIIILGGIVTIVTHLTKKRTRGSLK